MKTITEDTTKKTRLFYSVYTDPDPVRKSEPEPATFKIIGTAEEGFVHIQKILVKIPVGIYASDCTSNPGSIEETAPQDWSSTKENGRFTFVPNTTKTGKIGPKALVLRLGGIKINDNIGTFEITIDEYSEGEETPACINKPITKAPAGFYLGDLKVDPPEIGIGGKTTLSWNGSNNADYELHYNGIIVRNLPNIGHKEIDELQETTTFTLIVTTVDGDRMVFQRQATVTVCEPKIVSLNVKNSTKDVGLDGDTVLTLDWETSYNTKETYLRLEFGRNIRVDAIGNKTFSGQELATLLKDNAPNQSILTFFLTVINGSIGHIYNKKAVDVLLAPVKILYFKYDNPKLTGQPIFEVQNATSVELIPASGNNPNRLIVTGPGGPLEQYCGKTSDTPQIMYFSSSKTEVNQDEEVTLSWVVHNIENLVLYPGGKKVDVDADGKGRTTVSPSQNTTYVLTNEAGVTSQLSVTVLSSNKSEMISCR